MEADQVPFIDRMRKKYQSLSDEELEKAVFDLWRSRANRIQLTAEERKIIDSSYNDEDWVSDGERIVAMVVCSTRHVKKDGTKFHTASRLGLLQYFTYLFDFSPDFGDDVNVKNDAGKTPLDIAKEYENMNVVEYLESIGAKSGKDFPR